MKFLAPIVIAALLASCAAGPHPLPVSAQAHLASAALLPESELAIGCSEKAPCVFQSGVWYPPELAAHMVGAEICCTDCIKELRKVDRVGVDTVTIIFSVLAGGLVTGFAVAAGYEIKDMLSK